MKTKNISLLLGSSIDKIYSLGPDKIKELLLLINDKKFKVSDSKLSYRQINYLEISNVIDTKREDKKNWRKFNYIDLLFLEVIKELRIHNINGKSLLNVKNIFYSKKNKAISDIETVFILILFGTKMTLILKDDSCCFYDVIGIGLDGVEKNLSSFIYLNLNEIYNRLRKRNGQKEIIYKDYLEINSEIINNLTINEKENEILRLIRNKSYKSIIINKKDNNSFIIKTEENKNFLEKDILRAIKDKDYVDINLIKRDGNIVSINVKETHKI